MSADVAVGSKALLANEVDRVQDEVAPWAPVARASSFPPSCQGAGNSFLK